MSVFVVGPSGWTSVAALSARKVAIVAGEQPPVASAPLTAAGAVIVPLPAAEIPVALQTGVIDAVAYRTAGTFDWLTALVPDTDVYSLEVTGDTITSIGAPDGGGTVPDLPGDAFDDGFWTGFVPPDIDFEDLDLAAILAQIPEEVAALVDAWVQALDGTSYDDIDGFLDALGLSALFAQLPDFDPEAIFSEFDLLADIVDSIDVAGELETIVGDTLLKIGKDAPDLLEGGDLQDFLFGRLGDDIFEGAGGDDWIDGGEGHDVAQFSGAIGAYTVTLSEAGITIEDRRAEGDGADRLDDVEALSFLDRDWPLELFSDVASLPEDAFRDFVEVYIAYFNRAPDAEGLFFYGTAFAGGTTLEEAAQTFVKSPEYAATYPAGLSSLDFATEVYKNVLGRDPDKAGLEFWVPLLESGKVTEGFFLVEILNGAKAPIPPDADPAFRDQKLIDQKYLEDKTDIGVYFAVNKGMSNVANATAAMQEFDGTEASITDAVAAIDGFHAAALDPENGEFLLPLIGIVDDPFAAL